MICCQIVWNEVPICKISIKKLMGIKFVQVLTNEESNSYLVLSMSGSLDVSDFSQITGILSGYRSLILSASFFLYSKYEVYIKKDIPKSGCCDLYLLVIFLMSESF